MRRMKSRIALVVGLVMLLGFASVASGQEQITLVLGIADSGHIEFYENFMIPEFERRYPHIKVEMYRLGWGAQDYMVRYLGGAPPDVFQGGTGMFGLAAEGLMAPMNAHLDRHGMWDFFNQLPPAIQKALTIDGQVYGLPWNYSSDNFTYLANRFEEAGLDPDSPPNNWEELVQAGRRLARYDANGELTYQGLHVTTHHNNFAPFLYQAGGTWMNDDFTEVLFGNDEGLAAVEFIHSMMYEHRIIDAAGNLPDLANGGAAMQFRSASVWAAGQDNPYFSTDDVRVALPPMGQQRGQRITPNTWLVSSASQHQAEAFDFIAFALELETVVKMGQEVGVIPVWMEAVYHSPWADDPRWMVALESIQYGQLEPLTSPHWEYIRRNYVQDQLPRIFRDGESPSLIQEAARLANVWLQEQLRSGN